MVSLWYQYFFHRFNSKKVAAARDAEMRWCRKLWSLCTISYGYVHPGQLGIHPTDTNQTLSISQAPRKALWEMKNERYCKLNIFFQPDQSNGRRKQEKQTMMVLQSQSNISTKVLVKFAQSCGRLFDGLMYGVKFDQKKRTNKNEGMLFESEVVYLGVLRQGE